MPFSISCAAMVRGIPIPLPFFAVCFTRSRRANHVSVSSPSFGFDAAGVGSMSPVIARICPVNRSV